MQGLQGEMGAQGSVGPPGPQVSDSVPYMCSYVLFITAISKKSTESLLTETLSKALKQNSVGLNAVK